MIDALIQKGTAQVDVLETKDTWFGVTYQEDKEVVIKAFKELTEAGVYKRTLQIRLSDTVYCNCLQFCLKIWKRMDDSYMLSGVISKEDN